MAEGQDERLTPERLDQIEEWACQANDKEYPHQLAAKNLVIILGVWELLAEVKAAWAERAALAAERDEWKRINQSDNQCAARRLAQAEAERDDALARLAAAETALREIETIPYLVYGSTDAMLDQMLTVARAALAGSREQAATKTTRTITMRCHCGRGVTIGPDPWCEGCVQSAGTCDCVPAVIGGGA